MPNPALLDAVMAALNDNRRLRLDDLEAARKTFAYAKLRALYLPDEGINAIFVPIKARG